MRSTDQAFDAFLINNSVHLLIKNYAHNLWSRSPQLLCFVTKSCNKIKKNKQIYILGDWNCHFLGIKQIYWERWSRFYLPRGHSYLWSRAGRVTQPQPRVYNMIREELTLVRQNGAWKPRGNKGWSGLFYPPNGLNFQVCWFNFIFLFDPSWSESIRVDPTRTGGPSWSGPTFVPAYEIMHQFRNKIGRASSWVFGLFRLFHELLRDILRSLRV